MREARSEAEILTILLMGLWFKGLGFRVFSLGLTTVISIISITTKYYSYYCYYYYYWGSKVAGGVKDFATDPCLDAGALGVLGFRAFRVLG